MRAVASLLLRLAPGRVYQLNRGMRMMLPPNSMDSNGRGRLPRTGEDRLSHMPPSSVMPHGFEDDDELPPLTIAYPKEIVAYLDEYVVGQKLAKKSLAVGVYEHYKRVEYNARNREKQRIREILNIVNGRESKIHPRGDRTLKQKTPSGFELFPNPKDDIHMDKSNIVLLGPSGSGKTYLTTRLAKALNVPIALCDCTTLTQAGYVGDDVESVVQKLLVNAEGNLKAAQRGIVFLDEFDKIYTSSDPNHTAGNRDVGGRGVQQALLKLVEGSKCLVKNPLASNQKVEIDTTNILFIASGAFAGLDRLVARRLNQRSLGFSNGSDASSNSSHTNLFEALTGKDEEEAAAARSRLLAEVDQNDMISFGMVPELVGRFPVLVAFAQLDERYLLEVITRPRNNLIAQARALLAEDDIELEVTDCALAEMARIAVKGKTGARALRSILERALLAAKYECPGEPGHVRITAAVIRGDEPYEWRQKKRFGEPIAIKANINTNLARNE